MVKTDTLWNGAIMDFNFDFDALAAILVPIFAVAIGAAVIKKAIGIAITLAAILIIGYMVSQALGISPGM